MRVLRSLAKENIIPPEKSMKDFHVYYRNYKNFSKKIGFVKESEGDGTRLEVTPIGERFLTGAEKSWPEIFEHQLIKLRFSNPFFGKAYKGFSLHPYLFTLRLLSALGEKYLTTHELALRVSLSKKESEIRVVGDWLNNYRDLSGTEKKNINQELNMNRIYSARMTLLLFALTPALSFSGNSLVVNDQDRIRLILAKTTPALSVREYTSLEEWLKYYTNFADIIWPLLTKPSKQAQTAFNKYVHREEGSLHKKIKAHVITNIEKYFGPGSKLIAEEYVYETNDRANLLIESGREGPLTTIEVETIVRKNDLPGLLQAIKYKYMLAVQRGLEFEDVDTYLIAKEIHPFIKKLAKRYGVKTLEVEV